MHRRVCASALAATCSPAKPLARGRWITLNRPDRLNSFTERMHEELRDALANLGEARVVVLTGAGRGFCAGQDLNDRAVTPGQPVDLGETVERERQPAGAHPHLASRAGNRARQRGRRRRRREHRARLRHRRRREIREVHPELFGDRADPRQRRHLDPAAPRRPGARARPRADRRAAAGRESRRMGPDLEGGGGRALDAEVDAIASKLASLPPLGLAAIKEMIRSSWQYSLDEELKLQAGAMRRLGFTEIIAKASRPSSKSGSRPSPADDHFRAAPLHLRRDSQDRHAFGAAGAARAHGAARHGAGRAVRAEASSRSRSSRSFGTAISAWRRCGPICGPRISTASSSSPSSAIRSTASFPIAPS